MLHGVFPLPDLACDSRGLTIEVKHSLWLQKLVLLDLYRRLIHDLPYERWILSSYLSVFFVTYTIVQVFTFSECKPFHLYWQVLPDPGMNETYSP